MSVSMAKAEGVTVLTMNFDPQSNCPPLCQILASLCCSPVWCSVSERLRAAQRAAQSVLGALHIMGGLLNLALGLILMNCRSGSWWQMDITGFPVWLGVLFIVFGISCILSEKFPSPCLVCLNVIMNFLGVAFAVTGVVLYTINMVNMDLWWMCRDERRSYYEDTPPPAVPDPLIDRCLRGKHMAFVLLFGLNCVLILLSLLEFCVAISAAVLGIKALKSGEKNKNSDDPELQEPLLDGAATTTDANLS